MMPTEKEKRHSSEIMTREQYEWVFGPPAHFEPQGILDMWFAAYGGLVNKPSDALDYARVLMRAMPTRADMAPGDLEATERDRVWHITRSRHPDADLLTFSRTTPASRERGCLSLRFFQV